MSDRKQSNDKTLAGTLLVLFLGFLTFTLGSMSYAVKNFRNRLTFVPTKGAPYREPYFPFQILTIPTRDGEELSSWYLHHPLYPNKVILYLHGNGGNLGDYVDSINELYSLGYSILAVEYRGFGLSSGEPSEKGLLIDAESSLSYLVHVLHIPSSNILVYGFSLGSVPATWLASQFSVGGLIIHNGFTTLWEVAKVNQLLPYTESFSTHMSSLLHPIEYIKNVFCPVLVVHAKQDELCPLSFGYHLYSAIPHEKKLFIPLEGSHSNFAVSTNYRQSMKSFFHIVQ